MQPRDMLLELKSVFGKNYDYLKLSNRKKTNDLFCGWISDSISKLKDEIAIVKNMVLQAQMIMVWGDLDKLLASLVDISNIVNETSLTGTTFFRSTKEVQEVTDKLIMAEFQIIELMKDILGKTSQFKDSIDSALLTETSQLVSAITSKLERLSTEWNFRTNTIVDFKFI